MEQNIYNYKLCFIISHKYIRTYTSYIQYYIDNIQLFYPDSLCIIVDNNSVYVNDIIIKLKDYKNVVILSNESKCKFELGAYKVGISYLITNNLIDNYDYTIFSQDTFVLKNKYDFNELREKNITACSLTNSHPGQTFYVEELKTPESQIILKKINLDLIENIIEKITLCWCCSFILHNSKIKDFLNITNDIIITIKEESCIAERYLGAILYYLNNYNNYGLNKMGVGVLTYNNHIVDIFNCTNIEYFIKRCQLKTQLTNDIL